MKKIITLLFLTPFIFACSKSPESSSNSQRTDLSAAEILGNPDYPAFSYGGYREATRDVVPTVEQLKEDLLILQAMGVKVLRTYNTKLQQTPNLLEAIHQLKQQDQSFEMYIMLGTWIEAEASWTDDVNHKKGDVKANTAEIERAIALAKKYPDIVKIIAVGNEAMVQWAARYFVVPEVILKWVNHLQGLKAAGELPKDLWITSSDNYESWGGGALNYRTEALEQLIKAVDYVSLHTYPFHDSHYNPNFWLVPESESSMSKLEQIDAAMLRAKNYAIAQTQATAEYIKSLGVDKQIHIGETGWATIASSSYGATGSQAADEYKEKIFYQHMRDWTTEAGMSCFYFEAFDEKWKDKTDELGSENHFGLIKLNGQAKYALWDQVDAGVFDGLTRGGQPITKTYNGDVNAMMKDVLNPPLRSEVGITELTTVNSERDAGTLVTENTYIVSHDTYSPETTSSSTYPSAKIKLNTWEGRGHIEMDQQGVIHVTSGNDEWWGVSLEVLGGVNENLSEYANGTLHFDIKGDTRSNFSIGFQSGSFAAGTLSNNGIEFGLDQEHKLTEQWSKHSVPLAQFADAANFSDVSSVLYILGNKNLDGKGITLKNIYWTKASAGY